jgi:hypothetical protein
MAILTGKPHTRAMSCEIVPSVVSAEAAVNQRPWVKKP